MNVTFKRIHPAAILPTYAHPGDAGMDICAVQSATIPARGHAQIPTGLQIQLPPDTEAQVRPRSGLAFKHGITILNAPGTIDEGYRGEIAILLLNTTDTDFHVEPGMRIAQLVIAPILRVNITETDTLTDTTRGTGGFGSTGV